MVTNFFFWSMEFVRWCGAYNNAKFANFLRNFCEISPSHLRNCEKKIPLVVCEIYAQPYMALPTASTAHRNESARTTAQSAASDNACCHRFAARSKRIALVHSDHRGRLTHCSSTQSPPGSPQPLETPATKERQQLIRLDERTQTPKTI